MTVALLGGGLKVKQKLTGRLADALSELYLLSCVLKRFEDDGCPAADQPIVALAASNGLSRFEDALARHHREFPQPGRACAAARPSFSRSAAITIQLPIGWPPRSCAPRSSPARFAIA